jgi:release factor glutamine methyltransferase
VARTPLARTTVRDALDSALIALTATGCDTPRLDAEVLLAAALGVDRGALIADPDRGVEPEPFREYVRRRAQREPVAYILGRKGFRRLELEVDPRVLIPRPETEHVVEAALSLPRGARVVCARDDFTSVLWPFVVADGVEVDVVELEEVADAIDAFVDG